MPSVENGRYRDFRALRRATGRCSLEPHSACGATARTDKLAIETPNRSRTTPVRTEANADEQKLKRKGLRNADFALASQNADSAI